MIIKLSYIYTYIPEQRQIMNIFISLYMSVESLNDNNPLCTKSSDQLSDRYNIVDESVIAKSPIDGAV